MPWIQNIVINKWAHYSSTIPPKSYLIHTANIHSHLLTNHGAIRQYDNDGHHDRPESLTKDGTRLNRHRKNHGKGKIIFRRYRPDCRTLQGHAGRRKPRYANSLKFGGRPHVARPSTRSTVSTTTNGNLRWCHESKFRRIQHNLGKRRTGVRR